MEHTKKTNEKHTHGTKQKHREHPEKTHVKHIGYAQKNTDDAEKTRR